MSPTSDPALQAIAEEAVGLVGATTGLVLRVADDSLVVAATAGPVAAGISAGLVVPARGARGYALASGQPAALVPMPDDASNQGVGGVAAVPGSLLVAPAGEAAVIEVADKVGGGAFTFDDIELLTAFATVAAAVVRSASPDSEQAVSPARLGAELAVLAEVAPARYRDVARVVEALLASDR